MCPPPKQKNAPMSLSNHHRTTLEEIFDHQASGNIEWRKVRSLLEAVGTVSERHDGKLKVEFGPETEVLTPPTGKGEAPDERSRDYGDSRWGNPKAED